MARSAFETFAEGPIRSPYKRDPLVSFLSPEVYQDRAYSVETSEGTYIVPMSVCGDLRCRGVHEKGSRRFEELSASLRDYVGRGIESIEALPSGYVGRLSASGYLDCTEWAYYRTMREAARDLRNLGGGE